METNELQAQLEKTAASPLLEEEVFEKVAQFSQIYQGLEQLDHPLYHKLNSSEFQEKLAGFAASRFKALKDAAIKSQEHGSLLMSLLRPLYKGTKTEKVLHKATSGLHSLDVAAGKAVVKGLEKTKLTKPLAKPFKKTVKYHDPESVIGTHVPKVRTGRYYTEDTAALTEPLSKAQKVTTPLLATLGIMSVANSLERRKQMANENQKLMKKAAVTIDQLINENTELKKQISDIGEKVASFEREKLAHSIASDMSTKGMIEDEEVGNTAQKLIEEGKDLSAMKEVLGTVQGFMDVGRLHDADKAVDGELDPLSEWLLGK